MVNIELSGYFDKNFGDDIMHAIIVEHFPQHTFFVNTNEREMAAHLENYPNVVINGASYNADVFLNVTGTGFMYKGKRAKAEKLINMLTVKKKKYPRSAVINCSLEPFDGFLEERFVKRDLQKYDLITCRDEASYKYLAGQKADVSLYADIVFAKAEQREANGESILGVVPVRRVYDPTNYSYYAKLAEFCDLYCEKYNSQVRIFAFDAGIENDISAALSVKKLMKYAEKAEIVIYNSDINEFLRKFRQCSFVVGSRFHSIVEAYGSGIKSVAVYDRQKVSILCNSLGIPAVSKESFTPYGIMELLNEAGEPDRAKELKADAMGHIKCLEQFLNG